MKIPRLALLLPAFALLSACSQHPRSLVGVWRGTDSGQLEPNTILALERDGSGTHNRSGMVVVTEGNASWALSRGQLTVRGPLGTTPYLIISRTPAFSSCAAPAERSFSSSALASFRLRS